MQYTWVELAIGVGYPIGGGLFLFAILEHFRRDENEAPDDHKGCEDASWNDDL